MGGRAPGREKQRRGGGDGLVGDEARKHVGELYLADIGVPPELYARPSVGLKVGSIFAREEIVRLR